MLLVLLLMSLLSMQDRDVDFTDFARLVLRRRYDYVLEVEFCVLESSMPDHLQGREAATSK
jgi:hypothetical protein